MQTTIKASCLAGALVFAGACATDEEIATEEETTTTTEQEAVVRIGTIYQSGMKLIFEEITNPVGPDMSKVGAITACDPKALYMTQHVQSEWVNYHLLWFSNDGGQTWTSKTTAKGKEIACDHAQLASLDSTGKLWAAPLSANGNVGTFADAATTLLVDRIQGGDGSFYGVKHSSSGNSIYRASAESAGAPLLWNSPIATVGAVQVTGTGLTHTGSDKQPVGNTLAWSRRAFGLESNGTLVYNSTLLDGNNTWYWLNTGNERYEAITAAAPNIVYGLQMKSGTRRVAKIRIEEYDCDDGIDNDANGLKDSEDDACTMTVANAFCTGRANGTYCADRFQPTWFRDQANQNSSLVRCTSGAAVSVTPGVCKRSTSFSNMDYLQSLDSLTPADPPNTGRYCNVHYGDGTWDLAWTGTNPCAALLTAKPGAKIVRAGLYSTTGMNYAFAKCNNGGINPGGGIGTQQFEYIYGALGHTANKCIIQISPAALPVFSEMFRSSHEIPLPRTANAFVHNNTAIDLAQFGHGQTGTSMGVDRFGKHFGQWEAAYDHPINEGRPLFAVSGGIVIPNGSRERDVSQFGCAGTPNQGEIFVKYEVGSHDTYKESFVVAYAHVRKRLVVDGQTVKAGQILGYVAANGCAGGYGHLHEGVMRTSNTNAHTAAQPELGYRMDLQANTSNTGTNFGSEVALDPLGWENSSAFNPWAYLYWNTDTGKGFLGRGGWSIKLFKPGEEFRYP